jgi:hypothetical protein
MMDGLPQHVKTTFALEELDTGDEARGGIVTDGERFERSLLNGRVGSMEE